MENLEASGIRQAAAGTEPLSRCDVKSVFFFFNNLMQKFFILIHFLYSCTCFEHYCAHLQEDNCISTASGIVTVFR